MRQPDSIRYLLACISHPLTADDLDGFEQCDGAPLDWAAFVQTATHNRVSPLVYMNLRTSGLSSHVPRHALRTLEQAYFQSLAQSTAAGEIIKEVLSCFRQNGVAAVMLRGWMLGERVYTDPALRPFSDTDLLVRAGDVQLAKGLLIDLGYHIHPGNIGARFFEKHHLHLVFDRQGTVIELHWALDHKYTTFRIDCDKILSEAMNGELAGIPALLLSPENLLLSLCVHCAKHCDYIRYVPFGHDLVRLILNDGFLILFADIDMLVRRYGDALDWKQIEDKTERWQIETPVITTLRTAFQLLRTPIPAQAMPPLHSTTAGRIERFMLAPFIAAATAEGRSSGRGRTARGMHADLLFRPVRILDLSRYFLPEPRYIAQRYGTIGPVQTSFGYIRHGFTAFREVTENIIDYLYYFRVKRCREAH